MKHMADDEESSVFGLLSTLAAARRAPTRQMKYTARLLFINISKEYTYIVYRGEKSKYCTDKYGSVLYNVVASGKGGGFFKNINLPSGFFYKFIVCLSLPFFSFFFFKGTIVSICFALDKTVEIRN